VRLAAQDPASREDVRLRRSVAVRIGGRWRDTGYTLIREGHALWMAATVENAWNTRYAAAEQQAQLDRRYLWDPAHCGAGPDQDVPLRTWAMWDPLGSDVANLAGEWVKVFNPSTARSVDLGGWWLRDSMLRRYTFRPGTVLAPGATLTLYTGPGQDTPGNLHWGIGKPIFENAGDPRHLGDGAYLFDPQGDLRAAGLYPCVVACSDPLYGHLVLTAQPQRPESVRIRNLGPTGADLYGYAMAIPGSMYAFPAGTVIPPGGTVQVDIAGDPRSDTPAHLHWGVPEYLLPDAGGSVRVETFSAITVACTAWGSGAC
jgi:hypothetical protein